MSRVSVQLRVPIDATWDAGTRLQVYWDGATGEGTGTVDYTRPLLGRPVEVMPGQVEARVLGKTRLGVGRLGNNLPASPQDGVGTQTLSSMRLGRTQSTVQIGVSVPGCYGVRRFGVKAFDRAGQVQGDDPYEVEVLVSDPDPTPPSRFAFSGVVSGRVQFEVG